MAPRIGVADPVGESFSISERLIVAPAWGRVHQKRFTEGTRVRRGAALGSLSGPGSDIPLRSPVRGVFVLWLVGEGQLVRTGQAVACLRALEG